MIIKYVGEDALSQNIAETKRYISEHGGSGHIVLNSSGTQMTQRGKIQFNNATVADDTTNDKTIVTIPEGLQLGTTSTTALKGDTKYAGASSAGGAATSANKLNTNAGNTTTPVYFENGIPKALGYTLEKSVPSDAKFTDTTYEAVTSSANGLAISTDKAKFDAMAFISYGTCTTAAGTQAKVATLTNSNWSLKVGSLVGIKFTNTNTFNATASAQITLNVNNTGAKPIYGYGTATANTGTNTTLYGRANYINYYMYDGTYWVWAGSSGDNNTTYNIQNEAGTTMAHRTKIQFVGATVTDDSTNGRTVVKISGGGDLDARLLITSYDLTQVGATVTVTDGVNTYTDTFGSSLTLDLIVTGRTKYHVTVKVSGSTVYDRYVYLNYGEIKEIEVSLDKTTWNGIQSIVNSGLQNELLNIGDELSATLTTGETLKFRVAAIDLYEEDEVIFESHYAMLSTQNMNASRTNAGGWASCRLRNWLNNDFIDLLPADLKSVIAERTFKVGEGSGKTSLATVTDKIFLPMEYEVFGTTSTAYPAAATEHTVGGNKQWSIYATAANRIKYQGISGSAVHWWECSPTVSSSSASTHFCLVSTSGASNCSNADDSSFGVVPCFRIIKQNVA